MYNVDDVSHRSATAMQPKVSDNMWFVGTTRAVSAVAEHVVIIASSISEEASTAAVTNCSAESIREFLINTLLH